MPVHLYGLVCDMDAIMKIAKKHKLFVVEDCAQCFLGTDGKGRFGGTIGHAGSFSFQLTKHLSTGDGGILITDSENLAEKMRKFGGLGFRHIRADRRTIKKNRDLFQNPDYLRHDMVGVNYRMSELTAAVGLAQVEKIDFLVKKRQAMAKEYVRVIKNAKCEWLIPQKSPKGFVNSYYTFVALYDGEKRFGASWYDFRKKYMEFGGDGIYAAWALTYDEPAIKNFLKKKKWTPYRCRVAESLQPKLMQFTTNQANQDEIREQAEALRKTIDFFQKK